MSTIWPGNWPGSSSAAPARLCWTRMSRNPSDRHRCDRRFSSELRGAVRSRCGTGYTVASGTSVCPSAVAAIPEWLPRRPVRALIRGLTTLAYQRLRLASHRVEWVSEPAPCRSGHRRTGSALPQLGARPGGALPVRRRDRRRAASAKR